MRFLLLVCCTVFLVTARLAAQANNQQTFKVSGAVVNGASGEPVRGALVQISGPASQSVLAGADGRFEAAGLPAGLYYFNAQRPGFIPDTKQQRVMVGSSDLASVTVKLLPMARISGRVLDRDGEPIDGVTVQCMRESVFAGRKQFQQANGANTDETGHFLFEDLQPGNYLILTREMPLYLATNPKSEAARFVYPRTFYPDALTRDAAQRISLSAGEDMKVDMTLRSMRGNRITLTLQPAFTNVMAMLMDPDEQFGGRGSQLDAAGKLTFSAVPPGNWKIVVRGPFGASSKSNGEMLYGELLLDVGATDIDNLKLALGKMPEVQVIAPGMQGIFVQLINRNGTRAQGSQQETGGEIKLTNLTPDTYRVTVQPQDTCLSALVSGSVDLLRDELVVPQSGSVAPIQISKGENCASLTVSTKGGAAVVVITSDAKAFEPRVVTANEQGVTVNGLHEGDYKVYAFENVENLEYANPEAMRDFNSQTVRLEPGQKPSVQLEINSRPSR